MIDLLYHSLSCKNKGILSSDNRKLEKGFMGTCLFNRCIIFETDISYFKILIFFLQLILACHVEKIANQEKIMQVYALFILKTTLSFSFPHPSNGNILQVQSAPTIFLWIFHEKYQVPYVYGDTCHVK